MTITKEMIEAAAQYVASSQMIHEPKLPQECWHGFVRGILEGDARASQSPKPLKILLFER
jgi:hypothetical protein